MEQHINRFIYGTEVMSKMAEYDAYEGYENSEATEGAYCNNNCLNCMLECPYKEH